MKLAQDVEIVGYFSPHCALSFAVHRAGGAKAAPHFMDINVSFLWFPVYAAHCQVTHTHTHLYPQI